MIAWLGTDACSDPRVAGGKAAALSTLRASFPVPLGFVATPDARDEEIVAALAQLGARRVAVRSSGVDEDGASASFAGQHETVLAPADVLEAVARCRASAADERARNYRQHHGLQPDGGLPVFVQELLAADVAAVAFSIDPVSGDASSVIVNASYGLGESIVSGTTTPDTYRVSREGQEVSVDVGAKERMSIVTDDGLAEVPVPRSLRGRPALADDEARAIAQLVLDVERVLGHAVDVECAFADGQLYLLQARPVTRAG